MHEFRDVRLLLEIMSVPDSFPSTDRGKHSEGSGSMRQDGSFHQRHQSMGKGGAVPKAASERRTGH
jgi:hypothetical protein